MFMSNLRNTLGFSASFFAPIFPDLSNLSHFSLLKIIEDRHRENTPGGWGWSSDQIRCRFRPGFSGVKLVVGCSQVLASHYAL